MPGNGLHDRQRFGRQDVARGGRGAAGIVQSI
jgi:hypothetical protein